MERWDVAVVGGGASGLMAARYAAREGSRTLLLEGGPKPGKKLLSTGNGRCNLSNTDISPDHYRGDRSGTAQILARFPAAAAPAAFADLGLLCRTDDQGRVYPNSLQAAAVLRALWSGCQEAGVRLCCDFPVTAISRRAGTFALGGPAGTCQAQRVVLACGGRAAPRLSCPAGGYDLLRRLGHTVTPLVPALVPLRTSSRVAGALKGVRCRGRAVLLSQGEPVYAESGEVLFGEGQLSGICVFDLSARLSGCREPVVALDLLEDFSPEKILAYLENLRENRPSLSAWELFSGALPLRLGQEVCRSAGLDREKTLSNLSVGELERAVRTVKAFSFPITGPGSWDNAQVTAGGADLTEFDPTTLESRRVPGLYVTGELLNVDGDCGGYNLHWAWATGVLAGRAAGQKGGDPIC